VWKQAAALSLRPSGKAVRGQAQIGAVRAFLDAVAAIPAKGAGAPGTPNYPTVADLRLPGAGIRCGFRATFGDSMSTPRLTRLPRPTFKDVSEARRRNMAAIRGCNTKTELILRCLLFGMGYRYRLYVRDLPGRPDLAFPGRRKVVFVHGCFWHRHEGCANAVLPKSRADWWAAKLSANVERDARNLAAIRSRDWKAFVVWECEIRRDPEAAAAAVAAFLGPPGGHTTRPA
jgi:DNA mismatch endonuclease (patch repair protein)